MKTAIYRVFAVALASGVCLSAMAGVKASLDRNQASVGERVQLELQNDGGGSGQPNIAVLKRDFDILGITNGSRTQIVNGTVTAQRQFTVSLAPKHEGVIQIPALQWGADQSSGLTLAVGPGSAVPTAGLGTGAPAGSQAITMSTTLSPKQPYVQSTVVMTLKVFLGVPTTQASLDFSGNSDVLVKQIGEDKQSTESRGGRSFQVLERKYLLIPQRSGMISLKGPSLDAQVQDASADDGGDFDSIFNNFFGASQFGRVMRTTRPMHVLANAIDMNVLPRPAGAASNWLPAQQVALEETWKQDGGAMHVGDPVVRHLHLSALGVTGSQLPNMAAMMTVPDGFKVYPDQAKTEERLSGGTVLGVQDQDIALVAGSPGHYELPALHLSWWDTANHVQRQADLPAHSLDILPALAGSNTATQHMAGRSAADPGNGLAVPPSIGVMQEPGVRPWQWVGAGLTLLWLGTMYAWWRSRRMGRLVPEAANRGVLQATPEKTESSDPLRVEAAAAQTVKHAMKSTKSSGIASSLRALQIACRDGDAQLARRHVLDWAAAFWPQDAPNGLNAVAKRLADERLAEPLRQLERACYTNMAWQGETLAQAFAVPPKRQQMKQVTPAIPELYV